MATYIYEVNADNRLLSVSDSWCEFAQENGAEEIADRSALEGQPIWKFISGEAARRLYGMIFQKVRASGQPALVPFRCDSPTVRRFMRLSIRTLDDDALRLTSHLVRVEERPYMPLLDTAVSRSDEVLVICAWCKRIEVAPGEWLEVEDAVNRLLLFASAKQPVLSHSICIECEQPWR